MVIIVFLMAALAVMFGLAVILGAPYVPTRAKTARRALKLLNLERGQTLLDLGAGDGAMLVAAAKKGIRAVGYEINPILYLIAKLRTRKYHDLVDIKLADYWHAELPPAEGIYIFLIGRYMKRLDNKLSEEIRRPTNVLSYAFKIPGKKVVAADGELFLYKYSGKEIGDELVSLSEIS